MYRYPLRHAALKLRDFRVTSAKIAVFPRVARFYINFLFYPNNNEDFLYLDVLSYFRGIDLNDIAASCKNTISLL